MNKISKVRGDLGITQKQLAQILGWSQPRIANYEIGFRKPTLSDSRRIVNALNQIGADVTIDDVFPAQD